MNAALIVVAAGVGRRLGGPVHKALSQLAGRPLVEHTLRHLMSVERLHPVVLVGHPDDRQALTDMLTRLPRAVSLVDGGARRQDSVEAGLAALSPRAPRVVLVHDAARPFVPLQRLDELIAATRDDAAALLVIPVADTIKRVDAQHHDRAAGTVPRHDLRAAQTPQAFDRHRLADLLEQARRDDTEVTDEAALFEAAGLAVRFVEGSRLNFKVTTGDDLALAAALLGTPAKEGQP